MTGEDERHPDGTFIATVWFTIGQALTLDTVQLTPGFEVEHAKQQAQGRLTHAMGAIDLRDSLPVGHWTAEGWEALADHTGIARTSGTLAGK
jgi:hypothetical protein